MSYNTLEFIAFLTLFLIIYWLMPGVKLRQAVILVGNLVFYWFAGWECLVLVVITTAIVYAVSRLIEKTYAGFDREKESLSPRERTGLFAKFKKRSLKFILAGVVLVLGILIYVKTGRLLGWEEADSLSMLLQPKTILVPLGISYYTFSSVGYLLDLYWNKIKCERNFLKLFLCVTYFPIIVQGPITRYDKLIAQFDRLPGFEYQRVCHGIQLMLWGYFKKVVIADRLSLYTATIFGDVGSFAGAEIILAVFFDVMSLYADFSGCMDIVRGAAQAMGVTLELNFKQPFFSKSAAEFWRRWHITLGAWFKDYVYMPIAMNPHFMKWTMKVRQRCGARTGQIASTAIPLLIVWILTGLWHGTGKDYVAWGFYWGILIILGAVLAPEFKKMTQFLKIDTDSFGWKLFQMARTFCLFCGGRMLTETGSLHGCLLMIKQMFTSANLWVLTDDSIYNYGMDRKDFCVVIVGIFMMWCVDMLQQKIKIRESLSAQPVVFRWLIYIGAIVLLFVFGMYGSEFDAGSFVYGAF
ncbi:MAG: MBOAT family protein [Eubacterium sp.]|nr:MBOAT family protein [Eubacterium sp.]